MADLYTVLLSKLDESFNLQETRNYCLAIQFSESGFSYCILDLKRNKYIVLQQFRKNEFASPQPLSKTAFDDFLKQLITAMPWLKNPYKSVLIAYEGKKTTLIPAPLFDLAERESYLQFNYRKGEEEVAFSDHLTPLDNHLVFSMPALTMNAIRSHYPTVKIHHLTSVLIESVWINYKNRINANRVFLHLRERHFDLILFDGRQMNYCNAFPFQNAEDVAYYLIFVLEQLNLNPENIYVVLLGAVERGSGVFELLSKYVRHIEFARRNESYKYSYPISQVSPHSFYPLLNFQSCGL
jgi:hypothetical protein